MKQRIGWILTGIIILVLSTSMAYAMNSYMNKLPVKQYFDSDQTNAIWDWTDPLKWESKDLDKYAEALKMHQVNTVFVDVSVLADIMGQNSAQTKADKEKQLAQALETYITTMNRYGVAVYASAGNTDWSKPDQQQIPMYIMNFIHTYNENHKNKAAGIEFDIEAYNQKAFATASMTEKSLVLMDYMDTVDKLVSAQESYLKEHKDTRLGLGFAIPYWFDNENQNIESINWHDKVGPTLFHVVDRLQAIPDSNIVTMAYRNAAAGNDGMIYHARTEMDYAKARTSNVRVLVGIETTEVEPSKITFFGKSKTELSKEVELVHETFGKTRAYGGIAINDLQGFMDLPE